jgi:hypothetical protein
LRPDLSCPKTSDFQPDATTAETMTTFARSRSQDPQVRWEVGKVDLLAIKVR